MLKVKNKKILCSKVIADCTDIILSNNSTATDSISAANLLKTLLKNIMPYLRNQEKAEESVNDTIGEIEKLKKTSAVSISDDFAEILSEYISEDRIKTYILSVSLVCSAFLREFIQIEDIEACDKEILARLELLGSALGCTNPNNNIKQLDFINELLGISVPKFIGNTQCNQLTDALFENTEIFSRDTLKYSVYRIFRKLKLRELKNFCEETNKNKVLENINKEYSETDPESFVDNPFYIKKQERSNFVKGLQKYTLETLVLTKEFLESQNLTFYLTEGTLLGAVRHNGFIPWDDDIDIAMPRDDYEKLVQLAKDGKIPPELNFDALENNPKHWVLGAKMQLVRQTPYIQRKVTNLSECNGPYVDIFPLEYWNKPAGFKNSVANICVKACRRLLFMKTGYSTGTKKKPFRIIAKLFLHFISNRAIEKFAIKNLKKFNNGNRKYLVNLCSYYPYYKEVFPIGFFGEPCYIDFEGHKMPVPCEYDCILKMVYGKNYDTIPPAKVTNMRKHAFDIRDEVAD